MSVEPDNWHTSTYSASANCVEVAFLNGLAAVPRSLTATSTAPSMSSSSRSARPRGSRAPASSAKFLEQITRELYLEAEAELRRYTAAFERLCDQALALTSP